MDIVIDLEVEEKFKRIEKKLKYDLFRNQALNGLSLKILATFIKLCRIHNKEYQIHLAFETVLKYIYNECDTLFKIEREMDILYINNYFFYEKTENEKHSGFGVSNIEYECSNYGIGLSTFFSAQNHISCGNVPFSILKNPLVYVYNNRRFDNTDIYLIKLMGGEYLMIFLNVDDEKLLTFLYKADMEDIIRNSKLIHSINQVILPLMTKIRSEYHNIHNVLKNINGLSNCDNGDFHLFSEMHVSNEYDVKGVEVTKFQTTPNCLYINQPFLYFLLNKDFIINCGGIYDAHLEFSKDNAKYKQFIIRELF